MMKKLRLFVAAVSLIIGLVGCGKQEQTKEWTYELLENEFGGIIQVDYNELKDCLKLLSDENYYVCGYVQDTSHTTMLGKDLYSFKLSDNKTKSEYEDVLHVDCDGNNSSDLNNGDFVYVQGNFLAKVDYGSLGYSYQLSSKGNTIFDSANDHEFISVWDFYKEMDKIYGDTFFKVEGLIIKDGEYSDGTPIYYLYESEDAYKKSKYNHIRIKFSETQSNLNGKRVVLIGKPEIYSGNKNLAECSIYEEK